MSSQKQVKNNQYHYRIKGLIAIGLFATIILSIFTINNGKITKDENKFKYQYMKLNGKTNLSNRKYTKATILDQNKVEYLDGRDVISFLQKGTGILYFGFQQGNACRSTAEILVDLVSDSHISPIYYRNIYGDRDEVYLLEDGSLWTMKEASENYHKITKLLFDYLPSYEGLKDESRKRIYLPAIVFVKKGKVIKFISLDSQYDYDESKVLSKKDKKFIINQISEGIKLLDKDD